MKITVHFHNQGNKTFSSINEYNSYMASYTASEESSTQIGCFTIPDIKHHDKVEGTCTYFYNYSHRGEEGKPCALCGTKTHDVVLEVHSACGGTGGMPEMCSSCRSRFGSRTHKYTISEAYDEDIFTPACEYTDGQIVKVELIF